MALSNCSAAFAVSLPAEHHHREPDLPTSAACLRRKALLPENWRRQACPRVAWWLCHHSARVCAECRLAQVGRWCCPALACVECPSAALRCFSGESFALVSFADTGLPVSLESASSANCRR